MEAIQYIGLKELGKEERSELDRISAEYHKKIQRSLKNDTSLVIHIKDYTKGGAKRKFSIHARAVAPTCIFEATSSDWDFARTLHTVLGDLEEQINHRLHADDQRPKGFFSRIKKSLTPSFARKIGIKIKN